MTGLRKAMAVVSGKPEDAITVRCDPVVANRRLSLEGRRLSGSVDITYTIKVPPGGTVADDLVTSLKASDIATTIEDALKAALQQLGSSYATGITVTNVETPVITRPDPLDDDDEQSGARELVAARG